MMTDIHIIIYSYKGKHTKDVIKRIFQTTKNNFEITLFDQHPLNRIDNFSEFENLKYKHIFWDYQKGPCFYKYQAIQSNRLPFVLLLSDDILLNDNWDQNILNFINNKDIIISGNKKINIKQKDIFSIEAIKNKNDSFYLNQYIDRDFIFTNNKTIRQISYPNYLKYYGEEEIISIDAFTKGIDVYSAPTNTYEQIDNSSLKNLFVPFSLFHKYNECVELLLTGKNSFIKLREIRNMIDFEKYHNIEFKSFLNKLPFTSDDVLYDPNLLNFQKTNASKFVDKTRKID